MIVAVGIDVVLVERFVRALERTPVLAERLFTESERFTPSGSPRPAESLAARFAAKEAVAKALGAPTGLHWHDCVIVTDHDGRPWLTVAGTVADAAAERGVDRWHLSLSHDGGIASAMVVAEGDDVAVGQARAAGDDVAVGQTRAAGGDVAVGQARAAGDDVAVGQARAAGGDGRSPYEQRHARSHTQGGMA